MIPNDKRVISEHHYQPDDAIMVSIVVATYNHEKHIADALDCFLMQKTDFRVEILVNDDASTDKTAQIVKMYEEKYPHLFVTFYQTVNQYSQGKKPWYNVLFPAVRGKYIALCEGDDYWTDPLKLQKQVDFLEGNERVMCVTHNVQLLHGETLGATVPSLSNKILTTRDVLFERDYNYLPTGSYVFRQSFLENNMCKVHRYVSFGDWPMIFQLSLLGDVFHMQDVMGVYRKHAGGYTSNNKSSIQLRINNFYLAVGILYPEYWNDCQEKMKILENKIFAKREKELKSEEYIVNNNGFKKLLKIVIKRVLILSKKDLRINANIK